MANMHAIEDEAAAVKAAGVDDETGPDHVGPRAAIVTLAMRPKNLRIQRSDAGAYEGSLGSKVKVKDGALGPGLGLLSLPFSLASAHHQYQHHLHASNNEDANCDGRMGTPPSGDNCYSGYYDDDFTTRQPRLSIDDATSRDCSDEFYMYCPSSNASYGEPDLSSICSSSGNFHHCTLLPARRYSENAALLSGSIAAGGQSGRLHSASGQQQLPTDRVMMLGTMMKRAERADGGRPAAADPCTPLLMPPHPGSDCNSISNNKLVQGGCLFPHRQQQSRYGAVGDEYAGGGGGTGNGYSTSSSSRSVDAAAVSSSVFTSAVEVHVNHHYDSLLPALLTPNSAGSSPASSPSHLHHVLFADAEDKAHVLL
jgi:hypothetical protein